MKLISVIFGLLITSQSFAESYGDKHCSIVLLEAKNVITGGNGNYYEARVAVAKSLISEHFKTPDVQLVFSGVVAKGDQPAIASKDSGQYKIYYFKFPYGAYHHSETFSVIPFITNGIDRLYDNNSSNQMIDLSSANNWKFSQTKCGIK